MNTAEIIVSATGALSVIVAIIALIISICTNKSTKKHNVMRGTIEDFNKLQTEVLDKLSVCNAQEIANNVRFMAENSECKEAYDRCRALIARCEHFAVGVKVGVYDFDVTVKLGGTHLAALYNKVKPVIEEARNRSQTKNPPPYFEFEKLAERIQKRVEINNKNK